MNNLIHISNNLEKSGEILENGRIVYLPDLFFKLETLEEEKLISANILNIKHKNISYDYKKNKLAGLAAEHQHLSETTQKFMHRFALFAKDLINKLCPEYKTHLIFGRTSYRPAEIKLRIRSKRQDDTRLHVDAFPATPVNGNRILRIFCNINPNNTPRIWHVGEPFDEVLEKFAEKLPKYNFLGAKILQLIKATKTLRSSYDHYMLKLHDAMKLDDNYQNTVNKTKVDFKANSTWVVFTDQVSHAALSGQFLLEQTFYLPAQGMINSATSPQIKLEKMLLNKSKQTNPDFLPKT